MDQTHSTSKASILDRSQYLIESRQFELAENLLRDEMQSIGRDPELVEALGMLLCYTQRELEAAELCFASKAPRETPKLAQALANYFHCRALMAAKVGVTDPLGQQWVARLNKSDLQPEDVGIRLSACLIVKNEEANLDRCLASIVGQVDEIVVIDTGSTDGTIEIAERYHAKIGHFSWAQDFSAARNASLDAASGNWALWIDADEEVSPSSWAMIREGMMRPHFGGYHVRIVNYTGAGKQSGEYVHNPVRLFRLHDEIRFTGRIHEQVKPGIDALGLQTATLDAVELLHYGYTEQAMSDRDKIARTIGMLERELEENPNDPFHLFNLANTYRVAGRLEDVVTTSRKAIALLTEQVSYGYIIYQLLTSSLTDQGRYAEAIATCTEATSAGYGSVLIEFERAHALLRSERTTEALVAIERCMAMNWPHDLTGDYGIFTHKRNVLRGQVLASLNRFEEALQEFDFALSVNPDCGLALYSKGVALAELGRYREAVDLLEPIVTPDANGRSAQRYLGRAWIGLGEFELADSALEPLWKANPADVPVFIDWMSALDGLANPHRIISAYADFAMLHPLSAEMHVNLGRAYAATDQWPQALSCYVEAIKKAPADANAYFNCGDALYRLEKYLEAAQAYEAGLKFEPRSPQGWFVLGNCLYRVGAADAAELAYRQALDLDPTHQGAKHNLAALQLESAGAA